MRRYGFKALAEDSLPVMVPRNDKGVVPISRERVRHLRKHLIVTLRALRMMKDSEHSVSLLRPEPEGFVARVARTACSLCKGWSCTNGDDHAFLATRTAISPIYRREHSRLAALRRGDAGRGCSQ